MTAEVRHERVGDPEPAVVEVGPRGLEYVWAPSIVTFDQVRKTYDPAGMAELRTSIEELDENENLLALNLLNPLIIADLDEAQARQYIADLNLFWGVAHDLDAIQPDPDSGRYQFLIAGHRRLLAISQLAEKHGLGIAQLHIAASMRPGISFQEALIIQMQENTYERPDPTDDAEAIRLGYDFLRHTNPRLTQAQCAEILRRSPTTVSRALAYSDLPDEIKSWVKRKDISFNLAVTLGRIQEEYRLRFKRMREEHLLAAEDRFGDASQYASYEVLTLGYRLYAMLQRSRRHTTKVAEYAADQLATLRQQRKYQQQAFDLEVEVVSAHDRRRRALQDLGGYAFRGFMVAARADQEILRRVLLADPQGAEMLRTAIERMNFAEDPLF